jgi:hypothetical protein
MYRPILASLVAYGLYKTKRSFSTNDTNENDKEVKKVNVLRRV